MILAGFEGYPKGDIRNQEVENIFNLFTKTNKNINIYSITPTNYISISSKSIYGFNLWKVALLYRQDIDQQDSLGSL